ncbi:transposase [Sorangium cellulosum]|uniref:transposase n=1 Tax=Sorangium cellulosum TaxID=56 RepID=UPI003B8A90E6
MERTRSPANARGRSGPGARRRADAPNPSAARASRDRARGRGGRRARGSALCLRRLGTRAAPHVVAPQWLRGLSPSSPSALAYDKPLCAALDGFTLHAATRAGARHAAAREALLRYVLRPPIAKERVEPQQDGLVRLSLKRAFADGTVAVDMDPLSLLCRLAASVPPPRFHTVKYAGVLASASRPRWRASASDRALRSQKSLRRRTKTPLRNASVAAIGRSTNRAELLRRTCAIDVLECPACKGRMKLVAMVTEPRNIARFLSALGEPTDVPARSPNAHVAPAVLGVRGAGRRRRPGAPSVEEHRSAPQGAR